jgi:hypothetical protein
MWALFRTTPLKKIPSVNQTSLQVGKGSMFGPLSRTPPQHPVHGPNINMSGNNKYIRLKNMHNKCTKNLYLVKVVFDKNSRCI